MIHTYTRTHRNTPVAFRVHGHHVHGDVVLLTGVEVSHLDPYRREHSPIGQMNTSFTYFPVNMPMCLPFRLTVDDIFFNFHLFQIRSVNMCTNAHEKGVQLIKLDLH